MSDPKQSTEPEVTEEQEQAAQALVVAWYRKGEGTVLDLDLHIANLLARREHAAAATAYERGFLAGARRACSEIAKRELFDGNLWADVPQASQSTERTWRRKMTSKQWWCISVGGGYGSFLFFGTEADAENRRQDKARWEAAVARKRLATVAEITEELLSRQRTSEHPHV